MSRASHASYLFFLRNMNSMNINQVFVIILDGGLWKILTTLWVFTASIADYV